MLPLVEIKSWSVRTVLNSKAEKTVEVCINGFCSSPPSGTSRSKYEVIPWSGSVENVVEEIKQILRKLERQDVDPLEMEKELLSLKERLGGNGVLAISLSLYKAGAAEEGVPLWKYISKIFGFRPQIPIPLENIVGGGKHGGNSDIQEFLVFSDSFSRDNLFMLSEVYREVKERLKRADRSFSGCVTLESAWVTGLKTEGILGLLREVADDYSLNIGVDVAAGELFDGNGYFWKKEGVLRDRGAQIDYIVDLIENYGLSYVEDPLSEDDVEGFLEIQKRTNGRIVGDDLFATDVKRLINIGGAIVKYNQRGSIVETVEFIKELKKRNMWVVVSHRSGETEDPFLSHFAVGVGADLIKAGAAGIRIVKLNELLRIAEQI